MALPFKPLPADAGDYSREQLDALLNGDGSERVTDIANEMKQVMFEHVGVFRIEEGMQQAVEKVRELKERFKHVTRAGSWQNFQHRFAQCLGNQ